jgi:Tol biopolymer transport system component
MRRWLPIVSLVAALLVGAVAVPSAQAQYFGRNKVQYDQFDFRTLETENFVFYYYPAEERAVRDAARMAERWYARHTQVFLHRFDEKKPIIFYANDADFQQTNVTQQNIGPGTGGFTEPLRERVVMPFASSYGETNHVLGHELVHSFQYDLALNSDSLQIRLQNLPLWVVEGMAEYLSVGRQDTHTAMWMRDAVRTDNMPSFEALANPREYFPYRFGQAHLAYVAGKYGDQAVTNLYKLGGQVGLDSAYVQLFGISADSLTREWGAATREAYEPLMADRTSPDSVGTEVLSPDIDGGRINIAPALSPDGRYVAFISERELFNFNLFVADAETGEVIADLDRAGTTGHFNALRFINSAGTWSPNGRRLAFVSFADGDNQITIWNVLEEEIERSFQVQGVTSMKNPAWSPDGTKLAFTGTDGGISDLYVLDLETENVRQLTNDRYADLQPTWSPDGETIAFTTDRKETNLDLLAPSSNMDIGLIDVASGKITVRQPFGGALHHNPQFSPDGRSLYFVSDQDGFKDVYRMALSSGDLFRVTHLKTGVSGITALSPAMSVAQDRGSMMVSVYADDQYTGVRLPQDAVQGTPVQGASAEAEGAPFRPSADTTAADTSGVASAGGPPHAAILPPYGAHSEGLVASGLGDARSGLPDPSTDYTTEDYDPTLSLEGIAPPRVGASVGGPFGGGVSGGVAFQFGDMLGHQSLIAAIQAQGTFRDIGGGVSYMNRRNQLNWGGSLSHTPIVFQANTIRLTPGAAASVVRRAFITSASANASYPLSTTRRFEFSAGATRYGYGVNVRELGFNSDLSLGELNEILEDENAGFRFADERDTEYLASASAAYVRDFSTSGLTGPIRGGRWRLEVSPTLGTQSFLTGRADVRRYFRAAPFTFALQALHVGNYGAEFQNDTGLGGIGNEYIGYPYSQGFVRGYNVREIAEGIRETGRCTEVQANASRCAELERLFGTRALTTRAEIRVPLLGPERLSLIPFQYLPTTLAVFTDAGVTWTNEEGPDFTTFDDASTSTTSPVVSTGVAARFNVLGSLLLEMYYARPFQRTDRTWEWGLRISPGF